MARQKQSLVSVESDLVGLEPLLIAVGSYLYNGGEIEDIHVDFLEDINLFISAEIEKRGATIH